MTMPQTEESPAWKSLKRWAEDAEATAKHERKRREEAEAARELAEKQTAGLRVSYASVLDRCRKLEHIARGLRHRAQRAEARVAELEAENAALLSDEWPEAPEPKVVAMGFVNGEFVEFVPRFIPDLDEEDA